MQNKCRVCNGEKHQIIYKNVVDKLFDVKGKYNFIKCNTCLLISMHPIPQNLSIAYPDSYSKRKSKKIKITKPLKLNLFIKRFLITRKLANLNYSRNHSCSIELSQSIFSILFTDNLVDEILRIEHLSEGTLLDYGCGRGELLLLMKNLGWDVKGIEIDDASVKHCKKIGLNVYQENFNKLNLGENKYDVITMKHVIEHIEDLDYVLKNIKIALKQKGKIYITTPNSKSLLHKIFKRNWFGLETPRHLNIFNPHNLKILLENNGYTNISFRTNSRISKSVFHLSRFIKNNKRTNIYKFNPTIIEKIYSTIVYYFIEILNKIFFEIGDEILIVGENN